MLEAKNALVAHRVFQTKAVLRKTELPHPDWNMLLLSQSSSRSTALEFSRATPSTCEQLPGVSLRRAEVLTATPNSFHPSIGAAAKPDLKNIVEFIAVRQSPAALNAYREAMATAIGPALGEVVRRGIFDSMMALETASVHAAATGVPNWNQIHIRAAYPDDERNVALIDEIMDGVMKRLSPQSGGVEHVFERLGSLRSIVREDVVEELEELNVGEFVPLPS